MALSRDWELKLQWNVKAFYWFNHKRYSFLDRFYRLYYHLGKGYTLPLYLILFYWFGQASPVLHLALAMLFTGSIVPILKKTIKHYRPSKLLADAHVLEKIHHRSFPSADAAYLATIFAVALIHLSAPAYALFGTMYFSVAYGRMYMGVHFPLDIIVGSILGAAFAGATLPLLGLITLPP